MGLCTQKCRQKSCQEGEASHENYHSRAIFGSQRAGYTGNMNKVVSIDKVALLRSAFNGLSENELEEMAALTEVRIYPVDHILCQEGEYEETFYILAEGTAVISKYIGDQESDRVLRTVGREDNNEFDGLRIS